MTYQEELEEWLEGYLIRNPGQRAIFEATLAWVSHPRTRREEIERLRQLDKAVQASRRPKSLPRAGTHRRASLGLPQF